MRQSIPGHVPHATHLITHRTSYAREPPIIQPRRMLVDITISISADDIRVIWNNAQMPRQNSPKEVIEAVVDAVKALASKTTRTDAKRPRRDAARSKVKVGSQQRCGQRPSRKRKRSEDDDGDEDEDENEDEDDSSRKAKKHLRLTVDDQSLDEDDDESERLASDEDNDEPEQPVRQPPELEKRKEFFVVREHSLNWSIFVQDLNGKMHTCDVDPTTTTVGELMGMIYNKTGIPPEFHFLFFRQRPLISRTMDDETWEEMLRRTLASVSILSMWRTSTKLTRISGTLFKKESRAT